MPAFRGKGYGRLLMNAIIRKAKEKGYHSVLLDTATPMKAAIRLYQSYGFRETRPYHTYAFADILFMKMDLQDAIIPDCNC